MGLGYIGLPTAIIAAGSGIQVIGVDVNPKVVEMTNRGVIHIVEPGLQELCSEVVESGKLKASDVPEESDACARSSAGTLRARAIRPIFSRC